LLTFAESPTAPRRDRRQRIVWLIGEGWWSHDRRIDDLVFAMYRQVRTLFVQAGWQVRYRPHPSQRPWLTRYLVLDPGAAFRSRRPISTDEVHIGVSSTFIIFCAASGATACFIDTDGRIPNGLGDAGVPLVPIEGLLDYAERGPAASLLKIFGDRFRLERLFDLRLLNKCQLAQV
jgi:hypothetical protein